MRDAGIGVCVISWWGKGKYEDKSIPKYLDIADRFGLKIAFHIEPFYTSAQEFREILKYLVSQYGDHPAIYKFNGKPLYYIYDSYKVKSEEWAKVLNPEGEITIRNNALDATFIGLWVNENEGDFFLDSGFDGFYTYFASDGFVYGSTTSNWPYLKDYSKQNDLIFNPCVGPGYIDTRIRPWNNANTKPREKGAYYEKMFKSALKTNPDFIGITSFNEWHEGTQIEPAVPKSISAYTYEDYGKDTDPLFYIEKTRELIKEYK
jgi:glycoprotein endo-alpha-1,2-mannosidase